MRWLPWQEQDAGVSVGSVDDPSDRDAAAVGGSNHFQPDLQRWVGFGPMPSPPQGAWWKDPSTSHSVRRLLPRVRDGPWGHWSSP